MSAVPMRLGLARVQVEQCPGPEVETEKTVTLYGSARATAGGRARAASTEAALAAVCRYAEGSAVVSKFGAREDEMERFEGRTAEDVKSWEKTCVTARSSEPNASETTSSRPRDVPWAPVANQGFRPRIRYCTSGPRVLFELLLLEWTQASTARRRRRVLFPVKSVSR